MAGMLEHLGKGTFSDDLLDDFIAWCVWTQAKPQLITILERTTLTEQAQAIQSADDYAGLASTAKEVGQHANEIRQSTGVLGLSTAEAASFLTHKMASAAHDHDAEEVAFFARQIGGWAGFAEASFTDIKAKSNAEDAAQQAQEAKLEALWQASQNDEG